MLRPAITEALRDLSPGTAITCTESLDEAVTEIGRERYDLCILDATRTNGTLREFLGNIRQLGSNAPAIIVTGVDNDHAGASALRDGAADYLVRERFDPSLLARTIRHHAERKQLASAVACSEARYQRLLQSVTDYTYSVSIENGAASASRHGPGCAAVTGYTTEEYEADPFLWYRMVHDEDRRAVLEMAAQIVTGSTPPPLEHRIVHRDGSIRWIKNTPVPHYDHQGRLISYDGLVSDITERKQAEQKLKYASYHDGLTDLPNRELFRDRLQQSIIQARRHGRMLAVMVLDLDRFKNINETLGHTMGDQLLRAVAERLTGCLREDDTVARQGGDEFIILFADMASTEDASFVARKIQAALTKGFALGGQEYFVTASIGISLYPVDGSDVDTLTKKADAALYQAKAVGRNSHQFYAEALHSGTHKKLYLENSLRKAIEREEFTLHYQPLVNLVSGLTAGAEALVRWNHPELGLLSPLEFIPLAEETGLIVPLGEWILSKACAQAKEWQQSGFTAFRMSVNLSLRQFTQNAVMETVAKAIASSGLDPGSLELELTESMVMNDTEATIASLRKLKDIGVRLSLDDFGTGYSSLSRLKDLPLSTLKLDQSFVSGIARDRSNAAISRAIIALSHNLDLRVIAEGVETMDQLEFLRGLECDEVQGYLFCRPVPAPDMTTFMRNHFC